MGSRRRLFRFAVLTVAVVPVLALAPSASAAERSFGDAKNDALPQINATRLVVKNSKANAYVTVKMPKFKRGKTDTILVTLQPRSVKSHAYIVGIGRGPSGRFSKALVRTDGGDFVVGARTQLTASRVNKIRGDADDADLVRCKKLDVTWRRASVSVSVPQQCMGSNRSRLNVQAITVARITDADLQGLSEDEEIDLFDKSFDFIPNNFAPHWIRYRQTGTRT